MHGDYFTSILFILLLAIGILFTFGKFKIPSVIGFLLVGILAGPHGLLKIEDQEFFHDLSELGIILMLFVIGLDFSIEDLLKRKRLALLGGTLQVTLTAIAFWVINSLFGISGNQAIFYAILATLSSTAVVLKIFFEKNMIDSLVGTGSLSILIFQDIAAVLCIVFLPVIGGQEEVNTLSLLLGVLFGLSILAIIFIAARYIIPSVLFHILKTRNRELFLLTIILIIAGITFICLELELSVALGAFLAGLVISESDYSNYTLSHITPFQDLFTSVFFISIGFLFDPTYIIHNITGVLLGLLLILFIKIIILYPVIIISGLSSKAALMIAFSLAQVGEFSFVLAIFGNEMGLIEADDYKFFIAVTLLSMILTPAMIKLADTINRSLLFQKFSNVIDNLFSDNESLKEKIDMKEHVLIIGFGVTGKVHANICDKFSIPYIVIEMNPLTVRHEKKRGTNIVHGDATSPLLLQHLKVDEARAAIVGVPNHEETLKIIERLKAENPNIYVIARCPRINNMNETVAAGSDKAVAVELESAMEMLSLMMTHFIVSEDDMQKNLEEIRQGFYKSSRAPLSKLIQLSDADSLFKDIKTQVVKVLPRSELIGAKLFDTRMRAQHKVSLLAYKRDDDVVPNPEPDYVFKEGDFLFLFGMLDDLKQFKEKLGLI